ncbi:MAG: tRNA (adenosine(37)-N6)-dimethylallyltransferase MiaA [Desulfuromonas sp.]|nr:MAG: tRNA (adenosine(37)-N6)-dimethylallyltransferase MiaA [Desulfuromonas sp.]
MTAAKISQADGYTLVILGPTASGKTRLAVAVARILGGEILSADSRQVYTGLDIGSGKDRQEYGEIPCHLLDLVGPEQEFSLFDFIREYCGALKRVCEAGRLPVVVGGTGLYLDAVLRGYSLVEAVHNQELRSTLKGKSLEALRKQLLELRPDQHNRTDLDERERLVRAIEIATANINGTSTRIEVPTMSSRVYGLHWPREQLRKRIVGRLKERLEAGLIDEVAGLHAAGVTWQRLDLFGLEYRFVARFLQGELNRNDLFQKLATAIQQFAKRQETWFRRMERQGVSIHWLDATGDPLGKLLDDWRGEPL